jgi:hypothetical protein
MRLSEFDTVRIIRLRPVDRWWDGSADLSRPPEVGDEGTIVHLNDPNDPNAPVIVENVDANGYTLWIADLFPDEVELVNRPPHR